MSLLIVSLPSDKDPSCQVAKYIVDNPIPFTFQAIGGVAMFVSAITVPVLGAIGFSAVGPAAGSVAAGMQSSIGLVPAGSLFAWCQSVAMGGAALGGVNAGIFGGAGVVGAATLGLAARDKIAELVEVTR